MARIKQGGFNRKGFTMSELVVVIAVLGVLSAIVVPVYTGLRQSSLENAAVQHVRLLNAARDAYALTVPAAATAWNDAPDDMARLQLLLSLNLISGEPDQYLTMNGGYSVDLSGGLRQKTVLKCKGVQLAYR